MNTIFLQHLNFWWALKWNYCRTLRHFILLVAILKTIVGCDLLIHVTSSLHWRIQGGAPGRPSPGGLNSFIFMQFAANNLQNDPTLGIGAPLREILDPPLVYYLNFCKCFNRKWRALSFHKVFVFFG